MTVRRTRDSHSTTCHAPVPNPGTDTAKLSLIKGGCTVQGASATSQSLRQIEMDDALSLRKYSPPPRGLENLGNTCYINCALQCFAASQYLNKRLDKKAEQLQDLINQNQTSGKLLVSQFFDILKELRGPPSRRSICPKSFKNSLGRVLPQFHGYEQQDAPEFISAFIDLLNEELGKRRRSNSSSPARIKELDKELTDDNDMEEHVGRAWKSFKACYGKHPLITTFYGLQSSRIECTRCLKLSIKFEPFGMLSLPVVTKDGTKPIEVLEEAIDNVFGAEMISEEDKWFCPNCKSPQDAIRKTKIHRLPEVLVIHLMRFSYNGNKFEKLSNTVQVNISNNIFQCQFPCFSPNDSSTHVKYTLFGIINHSGRYHGGHYISYCCRNHDRWYEMDDNNVRAVNERSLGEMISGMNYVLFFEKRSKSGCCSSSSVLANGCR